jgi:hypothetical protein
MNGFMYQPPIQWVPGALSLGVKRPGSEADHSLPSSAEVKVSGAIPPFPNTPSWGDAQLKDRDNFTFTLWVYISDGFQRNVSRYKRFYFILNLLSILLVAEFKHKLHRYPYLLNKLPNSVLYGIHLAVTVLRLGLL